MEATPYIIVIDTREQAGYQFSAPISTCANPPRRSMKPYSVRTTRGTLRSGDYSLIGYESVITVERKSKEDLFNTLGGDRERFIRELERMSLMAFAAVVIECELSEAFANPPARSKLLPKTILASVLAWQQRYPRVHWHWLPGREVAEAVTVRILDRFWRDNQTKGQHEATIEQRDNLDVFRGNNRGVLESNDPID